MIRYLFAMHIKIRTFLLAAVKLEWTVVMLVTA